MYFYAVENNFGIDNDQGYLQCLVRYLSTLCPTDRITSETFAFSFLVAVDIYTTPILKSSTHYYFLVTNRYPDALFLSIYVPL